MQTRCQVVDMAAYVVEQGGFTFDLSKWLPSDIKGEPVEGTSNLGAALPNDPQQSPQVRAPRMRHPILHISASFNHARHPCFFIGIKYCRHYRWHNPTEGSVALSSRSSGTLPVLLVQARLPQPCARVKGAQDAATWRVECPCDTEPCRVSCAGRTAWPSPETTQLRRLATSTRPTRCVHTIITARPCSTG
jgi:hypothetical protein